jgi:ankyrin repeat protein
LSIPNHEGESALFKILYNTYQWDERLDYVLAMKCNLELKTKEGYTPLSWAATNNLTHRVEKLIAAGADYSVAVSPYASVLEWAIGKNLTNIALLIAKKQADKINALLSEQKTLLTNNDHRFFANVSTNLENTLCDLQQNQQSNSSARSFSGNRGIN